MQNANEKVFQQDIIDPLVSKGWKFRLCQFKPDHDLNPETISRHKANRLRVVPELSYSPNDYTGQLDLAVFVNGIPVATLELKSEFKQSVERAVWQYKTDRKPKSSNGKPEPLLTFKRGALVHFAASPLLEDEHKAANFGKLLMELLVKGMAA